MVRIALRVKLEDAHEDGVWAAAWCPSREGFPAVALTGSVDETVKAWRPTEDGLEPVAPMCHGGHSLGVLSISVDSTAGLAAASSLDSTIRVWELGGACASRATIECTPSELWGVVFVPSTGLGSTTPMLAAAGGSAGSVALYALPEGEAARKEATLPLPPAAPAASDGPKDSGGRFVLSVATSPDGRLVAVGAMDGTVAVYDLTAPGGPRLAQSLIGHAMPVRGLAFAPDGRHVVTACDDGGVHVYDPHHGELIESLAAHTSWAVAVAVAPGGAVFATSSTDRTVKLWEMSTRTCTQTVTEHTDSVWGLAFRPDGAGMISASDDKSLAYFDCI